ncbi:hypothetical protein [Hyphomicrobium sp.]|uniref:hypothetical protein n=1 Tax=Hyphomicrobium sp. TaxID=82 RepID=UPI003F700790
MINDAADRYWNEVGQYHSGADNTWRDLRRLVGYFGETKLLTEVTDDAVASAQDLAKQERGSGNGALYLQRDGQS